MNNRQIKMVKHKVMKIKDKGGCEKMENLPIVKKKGFWEKINSRIKKCQ